MNFEDLIQKCFPNLKEKEITLLQIGANDGQQSDPKITFMETHTLGEEQN